MGGCLEAKTAEPTDADVLSKSRARLPEWHVMEPDGLSLSDLIHHLLIERRRVLVGHVLLFHEVSDSDLLLLFEILCPAFELASGLSVDLELSP